MISLQKRNPGFDKDQRLLTLYDFTSPIILYVQLRVLKPLLKIKLWALLTKAWSPHVILSFHIPAEVSIWNVEVLCDHLFAWASKTHLRRRLRWGTFCYSRGRLQPLWSELT